MSGKYYGGDRSPERVCRKLENWPEADRRFWLVSLEPRDLLDAGDSRCRYRAISNRKTERGYGRWLTFLDRQGKLNGVPRTESPLPLSRGMFGSFNPWATAPTASCAACRNSMMPPA